MRLSSLLCGFFTVLTVGSAAAQGVNKPLASIIAEKSNRQAPASEAAEDAKSRVLSDLRKLGGDALKRADELANLPLPKVIESLAVAPATGPSTIAAPQSGASVPAPSVNWVGDKGGATTGHPGLALLLAKRDGGDTFNVRCSGTLIQQNVILTAAHCVCYSRNPAANYPTGNQCVNGDEATAPSAMLAPERWRVFFQHVGLREVQRVEVDDQYKFGDAAVHDDIALLVLSRPVDEIVPASIPSVASDAMPTWSNGVIAGFGYSAQAGVTATILEKLVLPGVKAQGLVSSAPCQQSYLDPFASLCSLFGVPAATGATICDADSGGPLWEIKTQPSEIGINSGRNNEDCTLQGTVGFQMAIAHRTYWDWINAKIAAYGMNPGKGRWPTFGENLRYVLDRRNIQVFDKNGSYTSDGWVKATEAGIVLATINSSGEISQFELDDAAGKVLCRGNAGATRKMPNVDYCWATVTAGQQFRVFALGDKDESVQFVITTHPPGTSFEPS